MPFCHVDADSFFASVLLRKHPHLRGKPVFALGMGGTFIIAASYEAKAKGVHTGMKLSEALKRVPDAVQMPSDFRETGRASEEIESILTSFTPLIEQMSIDEWYLDLRGVVGGVPEDPDAWAHGVRKTVLRKTGISVSVGIASSKLLAKMAGEYRKPGGVTVINDVLPIENFLRDRPAAAIPGIGHRRQVHTEARGWKTAWDIASAPTEELQALFGKQGPELQQELLGNALSEVSTASAPPKSVSRARSFRKTRDPSFLWAHLMRHAEYTVLKMRRYDLACRGLSVWLRDGDYHHEGASVSLPQPASTLDHIAPGLRACFNDVFSPRKTYTQVGLALWHLTPIALEQISLFEDGREVDRRLSLQKTMDELHGRFGRNAITRGSALAVKSGTVIGFDLAEFETAD
jgi:DNA polymerase IV